MTLQGIEENVAVKIKELFQNNLISTFKDLNEYDFISKEQVSQWAKSFNN